METLEQLRERLRIASPRLAAYILDDVSGRLLARASASSSSKIVNDPIWNVLKLDPFTVALLDTPLLQRLRFVRQLGLAHLVYPGAHHTRLEHSLGAREAALKMFDAMMPRDSVNQTELERLRLVVATAALMHDAGHLAFSHAGERALDAAIGDESLKAWEVLTSAFPDPASIPAGDDSTPPGSAELLSTLFVLSEAFEVLARAVDKPVQTSHREILAIAGLIIGRPYGLRVESRNYQFLGSLVSGDLDADKLDYVARDAFYAGIPISADVYRILSNLEAIRVTANSDIDIPLDFGGSDPDEYYLFGVRKPALSAVEMFVASRAYLTERIYGHHKVRAAEALLERALLCLVPAPTEPCADLVDLMLEPGGDDVVLARMASQALPDGVEAPELVAEVANRLQKRQLPHRALALSEKTCDGSTYSFPRLHRKLGDPAERNEVEKRMRDLVSPDERQLILVDRPSRNPIPERPKVYLRDLSRPDSVARIQHDVNIEQQANAYQGLKQVDWIFADSEIRSNAAAAGAIVLSDRYGVIPNDDAVARPKIPLNEYEGALAGLLDGLAEYELGKTILESSKDRLVVHEAEFARALPRGWRPEVRRDLAHRLASELNACGLPSNAAKDLDVVSRVLMALGTFADRHNSTIEFDSGAPETSLSTKLQDALAANSDFQSVFEPIEEVKKGPGFVDLLMVPKDREEYRSVVVELKVASGDFRSAIAENAGQPLQYIGTNESRIAILFVGHMSASPVLPEDTYQVWMSEPEGSALAVVCLGVRGKPKKPPSRSGRRSRRAG